MKSKLTFGAWSLSLLIVSSSIHAMDKKQDNSWFGGWLGGTENRTTEPTAAWRLAHKLSSHQDRLLDALKNHPEWSEWAQRNLEAALTDADDEFILTITPYIMKQKLIPNDANHTQKIIALYMQSLKDDEAEITDKTKKASKFIKWIDHNKSTIKLTQQQVSALQKILNAQLKADQELFTQDVTENITDNKAKNTLLHTTKTETINNIDRILQKTIKEATEQKNLAEQEAVDATKENNIQLKKTTTEKFDTLFEATQKIIELKNLVNKACPKNTANQCTMSKAQLKNQLGNPEINKLLQQK